MDTLPGVSAQLAAFAADLRLERLPDEVIHQARRCLVDWLACSLAGSGENESGRVRATVRTLEPSGSGLAPLVGTEQRASPAFAALANGFAAHVLDFDDTYNPGDTTIHGSAPLWSAIMAAAELAPVDGATALAAFVAGFEVQTRVARAAGRGAYDVGWHVTGIVGHIGAAAAVSRLLNLASAQTLAAIGTGATQAAGMKAVYGSMGKALHPGKAAMDGLLSGFLARDGFTSSAVSIEGHRGFLHLYAPAPVADRAVDELGSRWHLVDNGFKPYACGSLTHPSAQGLLELRERHCLNPDHVGAIETYVHDYVLTTTGNRWPTTGLESKFSIYHVLAVALADGAALTGQFTDARMADPALEPLRERITVVHDEAQSKDSARVVIRLVDGTVHENVVPHNLGTPGNPMTDAQLQDKLVTLATPVLGAGRAQRLAERCWHLHELTDVRQVLELAIPTGAAPPS